MCKRHQNANLTRCLSAFSQLARNVSRLSVQTQACHFNMTLEQSASSHGRLTTFVLLLCATSCWRRCPRQALVRRETTASGNNKVALSTSLRHSLCQRTPSRRNHPKTYHFERRLTVSRQLMTCVIMAAETSDNAKSSVVLRAKLCDLSRCAVCAQTVFHCVCVLVYVYCVCVLVYVYCVCVLY